MTFWSRYKQSISLDVVVTMIVMLIMSVATYWMSHVPKQDFETKFDQDYRHGFLSAGVARSLITATCCLLIYLRVRTWFALCMAGLVTVLAAVHTRQHLVEYDALTLAVSIVLTAILAPASWGEYFLTYRIIHKWRKIHNDAAIAHPSDAP